MIRTVTIGDIHGRDRWKDILFGSTYHYENWRREVDENIHSLFVDEYPVLKEADRIIFVGDYTDSFHVSNVVILQNLKEIVHLKRTYPDKVVLLLGNHDINYILPNSYCSGYRPEARFDLENVFRENADLFKIAHLEENDEGEQILWTHAGVTKPWFEILRNICFSSDFRFHKIFKGGEGLRVDELINKAWEYRVDPLTYADSDSGGSHRWAGPLWVRPRRLIQYALDGIDQIVGHTPQKSLEKMTNVAGTANIYIVDVLERYDNNAETPQTLFINL